MGCAAFSRKVDQYDESIQMPSMSPTNSLPTPPPIQPYPTLPPSTNSAQKGFKVQSSADQYLSVWDQNAKLSTTFPSSLKSKSSKNNHHQRETMNTKWSKTSSTQFDSTHVESVVHTQTHSCINLSTSERIDELIHNLNHIHTQQDESIKRRTQKVSAETESVLAHIIDETQEEQQRLLVYAKEQQTKQDEHYRHLLQTYVSQLDEKKAKELAQLQEELQECREQIIQVSHMKIMSVNEQANITKSHIVTEEQQQASMKIDAINAQMQHLPIDNTFQQLGSEIMTKTNVIVNATVGTKATGQSCSHEFVEDVPLDNDRPAEPSRHGYTKTTYSETNTSRELDHEQAVSRIGKRIPINPTSQVQKSR